MEYSSLGSSDPRFDPFLSPDFLPFVLSLSDILEKLIREEYYEELLRQEQAEREGAWIVSGTCLIPAQINLDQDFV